jgi:hypothetical protein
LEDGLVSDRIGRDWKPGEPGGVDRSGVDLGTRGLAPELLLGPRVVVIYPEQLGRGLPATVPMSFQSQHRTPVLADGIALKSKIVR